MFLANHQGLHASAQEIQWGPSLHLIDGKIRVRVYENDLIHPRIQWRLEGVIETIPMVKDENSFWSVDLEKRKGEYRVIADNRSSAWHPILNQREQEPAFTWVAYGGTLAGINHTLIHQALLRNMSKEHPSFIVHTGDMVLDGDRKDFWRRYYLEGKDLLQSIPLQPTIGQLDRGKTGRFISNMDIGTGKATHYYFRYGPAHFIALDSTRKFTPKSAQYRFLKETLEKLEGLSPIIVYFYHPAFSSSFRGSHKKVQEHLVPLFEKYGVDLVLNGSDRTYQRYGPINGVSYIVTAGGGGPLQRVESHPALVDYQLVYHFLSIQVDQDRLLGKVIDTRGIVLDTFEISHRENPIPANARRPLPKIENSKRYYY